MSPQGCIQAGVPSETPIRSTTLNRRFLSVTLRVCAITTYPLALDIAPKAARQYQPADREASLSVAIVNEAFARRYWPGQSALGRRVKENGAEFFFFFKGAGAHIIHPFPPPERLPD